MTIKREEVAIGVGGPEGDSTVPAPQAVAMDMSLFIRMLEVAREELKTDEQLHRVAERIAELGAQKTSALTMEDYDSIMSVMTQAPADGSGMINGTEFVASSNKISAVDRLRTLSALKENAGTVKDASLAIQQIFQRNGVPLVCRPNKGDRWDDPHVYAKGKTKFGRLEFALYLSPNKKDLLIDWFETDGLYMATSILDEEAAKFRALIPESTKGYDVNRADKTSMMFAGVADRIAEALSEGETLWGDFAEALKEIKQTMKENAVQKG